MNDSTPYRFRLYVARDTQNSSQAITNLNVLCKEHLPGQFEIEIVDVFAEPEQALENHIMMTPTLVRLVPSPVVKIIGTLSDLPLVLHKLGLEGRST